MDVANYDSMKPTHSRRCVYHTANRHQYVQFELVLFIGMCSKLSFVTCNVCNDIEDLLCQYLILCSRFVTSFRITRACRL